MHSLNPDTVQLLHRSRFFADLSPHQLEELLPLIREISFAPSETIVCENEPAIDLYVIKEGEVEVIKKEEDSEEQHRLSILGVGETFGEMALLEQGIRSASVRALRPTIVLALSIAEVRSLSTDRSPYAKIIVKLTELIGQVESLSQEQPIYAKLSTNLAQELSARLRRTNAITVQSLRGQLQQARARVAMGSFMVNVFIILILYVFSLRSISIFSTEEISTAVISVPIIIIFSVVLFLMMRSSGYPLSLYGLTLINWRSSAWEGVIFTIPLCILVVIVKWALINIIPNCQGIALFSVTAGLNPSYLETAPIALFIIIPLVYLICTPLQELICRGALQSSLQEFLVGPNRTWWAILVSNLLFSVTHLHVSISLALSVFLPGLFWGWMYSRHRTLVGVSISHLLLGGWVFFVVGIEGILMY